MMKHLKAVTVFAVAGVESWRPDDTTFVGQHL